MDSSRARAELEPRGGRARRDNSGAVACPCLAGLLKATSAGCLVLRASRLPRSPGGHRLVACLAPTCVRAAFSANRSPLGWAVSALRPGRHRRLRRGALSDRGHHPGERRLLPLRLHRQLAPRRNGRHPPTEVAPSHHHSAGRRFAATVPRSAARVPSRRLPRGTRLVSIPREARPTASNDRRAGPPARSGERSRLAGEPPRQSPPRRPNPPRCRSRPRHRVCSARRVRPRRGCSTAGRLAGRAGAVCLGLPRPRRWRFRLLVVDRECGRWRPNRSPPPRRRRSRESR